ncbi:MAG: gamma-glutamyl-gamma-aminobutyrate hydrolase family protein [Gemmatimonadetes bacterium]|nr:gamma-glutamyl-gamma-aminobutyrate hydrolase family protein [Gemmatimonadota bacterium]
MRPLIATTTTSYEDPNYRTPQIMLGSPYIAALEAMGGTPLLVTPAHDEESIGRLIDLADGLVLTGGEDVDPAYYGQEPHTNLASVNRARDRMEMLAVERAIERGMPVLAICRGLQLLNVALGGTLFQDLPSQRAEGIIHEQSAPITERWHSARIAEESQLAQIFGATDLFINSFHHQGINRLAEPLRPVAWAEDGLIEGVEGRDHPWMIGVQWHPERGEAETRGDRRHPDNRLFYAYLEAARKFGEETALAYK